MISITLDCSKAICPSATWCIVKMDQIYILRYSLRQSEEQKLGDVSNTIGKRVDIYNHNVYWFSWLPQA